MSLINKYQIFCNDENSLQYTWSTIPPTTCPNNATHSVDNINVYSIEPSLYTPISGITFSAKSEIMLCDTINNSTNILLPDATLGNLGLIRAKKISANNSLNIIPINSQTIDGSSILTGTTLNTLYILRSTGADWATVNIKEENQYYTELGSYLSNSVAINSSYQVQNTLISGPVRHSISTPNASNTSGAYITAGSYIFPGANFVGAPVAIKSIVRGGTGDIRIFSLSGATAVAGATITALQMNTVVNLNLTNNFNSVPLTEDTWEIQIRRNVAVGGGNVFTQNTMFYY